MAQSFLTQLGKGFIRSAVNQVGRDGGKIISNQIYGNQHSTPIRIVPDNETGNYDIPDGLHFQNENIVLKTIGALFLSIIPFISAAILTYRGIVNINRKTRKLYKTEQIANYVQDRRYKTGVRHVGYTNTEVFAGEVEDLKYRRKSLIKGILYLLIALTTTLFYIYVIYYKK